MVHGRKFELVAASHPAARKLLQAYKRELDVLVPACGASIELEWDSSDFAAPRGRVFVAFSNAEAVACAGLREHSQLEGEIKRFYVAPEVRRRGVARELLLEIERVAKELGYERLVLDTAEPLVSAARLYETSGYVRVAPFNDNPYAALWFSKDLY